MGGVPAKADSVYDFLYVDIRRLGIFLSQQDSDGFITELSRSSELSSGSKKGLDAKVIHWEGDDASKQSLIRKFDPQWLLPLIFLDKFGPDLVRSIKTARLGDLVLVSGSLYLANTPLIEVLWQVPAVRRKLGLDQTLKAAPRGKKTASTQTDEQFAERFVRELIPMLPYEPQVHLIGDEGTFWASASPANLISAVRDLGLKHGARVAGEWSMVGILDAEPDSGLDDFSDEEKEKMALEGKGNLGRLALLMGAMSRKVLGRPETSYGVTPILVFRQVTSASSA